MLEISCGACVYTYVARTILNFILKVGVFVWCLSYIWSLCLVEGYEVEPVFMHGKKAILIFILKGGACVWCRSYQMEPVSDGAVVGWSLCLCMVKKPS